MRLPFFDRFDFLMTKALLAIVGVGVPIVSIGWPLVSWIRDEPLRWTLDGLGATTVPDRLVPQGGVSLQGADSIAVRIEAADTGAWLATLLPGLLLSVTVGLAAWLLLRVVQRIENGQPFVSASAVALRLVGAAILLGSLAVSLGIGAADVVITERALEGADPTFGFEVNFIAFVAALLMLALAEAFAQGARLEKDVEGLV